MGRTSVPCGAPKRQGDGGAAAVGRARRTAAAAWRMASHSMSASMPGGRGLVVVAGGVQADHGVEVDDAAGLVLGHLDVPDPHQGAEPFLGDAQAAGQVPGQVGGEPAPQVPRPGVEQHGGGVVVAVAAHRLAEPGVLFDVAGRAGDVPAMRAAAGVRVAAGAAGQDGLAAHPAGVDRAEGRGGEGGEHARVRGDRSRGCPCRRPGPRGRAAGRRACTPGRAGRADGLAAVAAGDVEHSPVLGRGVVDRGGLAGGQVDGVDAAAQPDRVRAVAGGGELAFPGAEVSPGDASCRRRPPQVPGP